MKKHWNYKGTPVKFDGTANELKKFEADNGHLVDSEVSEAEYESIKNIERKQNIRKKRASEYKNGDYIDAIMKQFNIMRESGAEIEFTMMNALRDWQKVKTDNPIED